VLKKMLNDNTEKNNRRKSNLTEIRMRIGVQAGLAVMAVVVTVVLLFAATTAWYSNVLQTSGLTFEAASWGFDGAVTIEEFNVQASPGDSGVVELSVENHSDRLVQVSVNVSKAAMDTNGEMQKRIYFYIDASEKQNGEVVDRIYLNSSNGYSYTLLSRDTLILNEDIYNGAQVKWEWVYDVLGYYMLGSVTETGAAVYEYLRPIEYDYDEATFTKESDEGVPALLTTVDGKTTVPEFLAELSQSDGYLNNINTESPMIVNGNAYYPVEVDENGYGVWVYLYNRGEIEGAMDYDTALGEAAANATAESPAPTYTAVLNVIGQQKEAVTAMVSTPDALKKALEEGTGDVIQLEGNLTLNSGIELPEGSDVVLDLNHYTLSTTTSGDLFGIGSGTSMVVLNGAIEGSGSGYGFRTNGGELLISEVKVSGMEYGLLVQDNAAGGDDSSVRIKNSELTSSDCAVMIRGNGSASAGRSQLIIENSTVNSTDYVGIIGNGSDAGSGNWGTDIQIIGSTVTGYYAGIFHPQQKSTLTVRDSVISGITGIALKGGEITIEDCEIKGTGTAEQITEPALSGSGFADTGDGVYIETNYSWPTIVKISGENMRVTSVNAYAVRQYESTAEHVSVVITGGIYSSDVTAFVPSDGSYSCSLQDGGYKVSPVSGN